MSMIEMKRLSSDKETENKLRWSVDCQKAKFELYIPKWRVPRPWPNRIHVTIEDDCIVRQTIPSLTESEVRENPARTSDAIVTVIRAFELKKHTVRFQSTCAEELWEIGEPYIPFDLLPPEFVAEFATASLKMNNAMADKNADELASAWMAKPDNLFRITVRWDMQTRGRFGDATNGR